MLLSPGLLRSGASPSRPLVCCNRRRHACPCWPQMADLGEGHLARLVPGQLLHAAEALLEAVVCTQRRRRGTQVSAPGGQLWRSAPAAGSSRPPPSSLTQVIHDVHAVAMLNEREHGVAACSTSGWRGASAAPSMTATRGPGCSPMKPTPPVTKMLPADMLSSAVYRSVQVKGGRCRSGAWSTQFSSDSRKRRLRDPG